jgi:outer membrane receptor protein involved in Fe transport
VRYNLGIGNESVAKTNWGFNLLWRWQDKVNWQGTFGSGSIDSYGTFDAQISHKFPKIKGIAKIGGSNLLNKYYISAFGNPMIGGVYYISFGYNLL